MSGGPIYVPPVGASESAWPHWTSDPLDWEVQQERWRHNDALFRYGEYSMLVLLWRAIDAENGLVGKCEACHTAWGEIAETFNQPAVHRCVSCFGTTFEGGYRAKIVRPTIWDFGAETNTTGRRGEVSTNQAQIQSTGDYRLSPGDFVFRGDGTRWRVQTTGVTRVHSGFQTVNDADNLIAYNSGQVVLEDDTSAAWLIEPRDRDTLRGLLDRNAPYRVPADFSLVDEIRTGVTLL